MDRRLLCLALLSVVACAAVAQPEKWTRPESCPAVLHALSATPQHCRRPAHGAHACSVAVKVSPPVGPKPCEASIANGVLQVERRVRPAITWKINAACGGAGNGNCAFAMDDGIAILKDPASQMYDKKFNPTRPLRYLWKDKNHPKSEVAYEPHVWWRATSKDPWQACCPIDPKILNDGQ